LALGFILVEVCEFADELAKFGCGSVREHVGGEAFDQGLCSDG